MLHKTHDRLSHALAPLKAIDLFTVLPVELVEMIFAHVPFRTLWIDLSDAKGIVKGKTLLKYAKYAGDFLEEALLERCDFQGNNNLQTLVARAKRLRILQIRCSGALSKCLLSAAQASRNLKSIKILSDGTLTQATVVTMLDMCPGLEEAQFNHVQLSRYLIPPAGGGTKLKRICISLVSHDGPVNHGLMIPPSKCMTDLRIHYLGKSGTPLLALLPDDNVPLLEIVELVNVDIAGLLAKLPCSVRELQWTVRHEPHGQGLTQFRHIQQDLPNLELLNLGVETLSPADALVLRQSLSKTGRALKWLSLTVSYGSLKPLLDFILLPRCAKLSRLSLHGFEDFDDSVACSLAGQMRELDQVSFHRTIMTGYGVKQIVLANPQLKRVSLIGASAVSADAISWTRSRGVHINSAS
ncbi:hypothetical protein MRB53_039831 [Persea americana]|nr:hypothetical protein MRB53_039831 [Persea americana]